MSTVQSIRDQKRANKIDPEWIDCLYCSVKYPHVDNDRLSCNVLESKMDGHLESSEVNGQTTTMTWFNYKSGLHDGELHLVPNSVTSRVHGLSLDGKKFSFEGPELKIGKWPGFLIMHTLDYKNFE